MLRKICCVAFSIIQTYLIRSAVEFVQAKGDASAPTSYGYSLIAAFGLVYSGLAVCQVR